MKIPFMKFLEKKEKSIEDIIEKEVENKQKANLEKSLKKQKTEFRQSCEYKKKFRIQVASFKEKKKVLRFQKN